MSQRLPVHERFHTWQGEGRHLGRAAYFIRTYGCPVHCPWCDSAGTWHPEYVPSGIERIGPDALAEAARQTRPDFVVVTGGEPAVHDLAPLCDALHAVDLPVHLETSGAFPIRGEFDWITLSPKRWKLPLEENIGRAHEFKCIIDGVEALDEWHGHYRDVWGERDVWLHPEWSRRANSPLLDAITEWVKEHGYPYRAGWQLHKCYQVDRLDPGSRPNVPLGGNPALGY